ncbi:chitin binding peritrophin-A domain-containing protein [Nostoc sp. UIC 10607]|uniref:chitin binding peritrophin-A domain-containing protein n=1 Tax=Nostoc sp. UIC 10607 TaxID=3045935 RepID=UPI00399FC9EE
MKKILLCCCAMILAMWVAISPALAADSNSPAPATDSNSTALAGKCTSEGFFVNPEDCTKFFRCVDFSQDGKSFTKFDFDCGEGTIFDESISVCNHPWAVSPAPKCKQAS